jgi:hypothetical protein
VDALIARTTPSDPVVQRLDIGTINQNVYERQNCRYIWAVARAKLREGSPGVQHDIEGCLRPKAHQEISERIQWLIERITPRECDPLNPRNRSTPISKGN